MVDSGVFIGIFEPLHLGHLRSILAAAGVCNQLHVIIVPNPSPNPNFQITLQDKARWLQMACAELPFIQIRILDSLELPVHELQDNIHVNIELTNQKLNFVIETLALPPDSVFFTDASNPLARSDVAQNLILKIMTTPNEPEFDTQAIAQNPIAHWDAIHPVARRDYTKTVAIVGGESSGKTTLVYKLANYYGASLALEMGRLYVGTDLGGSEIGLQYSDYAPIALNHAAAIREARANATAPITFVDTDFVTTQAFCEEYEGRTHPFLAACIDEFCLDFTIMLDNNTPWVADGMRSLGSLDARARFEQRLLDIFERHQIAPYLIDKPDYDARYHEAIAFIDKYVLKK